MRYSSSAYLLVYLLQSKSNTKSHYTKMARITIQVQFKVFSRSGFPLEELYNLHIIETQTAAFFHLVHFTVLDKLYFCFN